MQPLVWSVTVLALAGVAAAGRWQRGQYHRASFHLAKLFSKVHDDVIKATHNEQVPTAYGLLPFEDLYFKYPG